MKVYPVVLLLLLVRARDWRALGISVLTGLTATWISFRVYGGGIIENSEALWDSVNRFRSESLDVLLMRNHSFKGGLATLVVSGPDWIDGIAQWGIDHYDTLLALTALGAAVLVVVSAVSPPPPPPQPATRAAARRVPTSRRVVVFMCPPPR